MLHTWFSLMHIVILWDPFQFLQGSKNGNFGQHFLERLLIGSLLSTKGRNVGSCQSVTVALYLNQIWW